ncbi:hypothetical protein NBRC116590_18470 [Pelagimonas sp. KU-00592-HH]
MHDRGIYADAGGSLVGEFICAVRAAQKVVEKGFALHLARFRGGGGGVVEQRGLIFALERPQKGFKVAGGGLLLGRRAEGRGKQGGQIAGLVGIKAELICKGAEALTVLGLLEKGK